MKSGRCRWPKPFYTEACALEVVVAYDARGGAAYV